MIPDQNIVPGISEDLAAYLLTLALVHHKDILGYRDFGGPEEDDEHTEHDQILFMQELATDALTGSQPAINKRLFDQQVELRLDPISAGFLAHMGINPACALALHHAMIENNLALGLSINDQNGRKLCDTGKNAWTILWGQADRVRWWSTGFIDLPRIPAMFEGRVPRGGVGRFS